jgi:hypothetical protein
MTGAGTGLAMERAARARSRKDCMMAGSREKEGWCFCELLLGCEVDGAGWR